MRPITLLLLFLLAGLQYALWLGDKNVVDLMRLEDAVVKTDRENGQQEIRNQRLLAEVIDLKQGGETVETLARFNLGLIKPDETFYQIID
jgi:cell division protein FtsB